MTARRDGAAGVGAVVRKPPKNEPAMEDRVQVPQALSYVGLNRLYKFELTARILLYWGNSRFVLSMISTS
jgi:hypothetical protein